MLKHLGLFASKTISKGARSLDVAAPTWGKAARSATFLGASGLFASSCFMFAYSSVFQARGVCPVLERMFTNMDAYAGVFETKKHAAAWLDREFMYIANACRLISDHLGRVRRFPQAHTELHSRTLGLVQQQVLPVLARVWHATSASATPPQLMFLEQADLAAGKATLKLRYAMRIIKNALGNKYKRSKPQMIGGLDLGPARAELRKLEALEAKMYASIDSLRSRARVMNLGQVHARRHDASRAPSSSPPPPQNIHSGVSPAFL